MRNDGENDKTNWRASSYDRALTIDLINGLRTLPGVLPGSNGILFNDPKTIALGLTQYYKGHDNHLHVTFRF